MAKGEIKPFWATKQHVLRKLWILFDKFVININYFAPFPHVPIYLFIYFKSLYRVACSVRDWSSTGPCAIKYRVKSDKVHTYNKIKLYKN